LRGLTSLWINSAMMLTPEIDQRRAAFVLGRINLTGKETESWEILYFKVYKSQLPIVERALEVAGLMLGSDKSRGYCLEMICADFLAGASLCQNESLPHDLASNFEGNGWQSE
jgi:hypothetical protein